MGKFILQRVSVIFRYTYRSAEIVQTTPPFWRHITEDLCNFSEVPNPYLIQSSYTLPMFGKKYLKLPKYYRGFRAVSVIFRCGGVLYFSLTFRYFSSDMTDYRGTFFYRHETKTTKDCADRRVSLDLKILFSSRDSFHEKHACTRFFTCRSCHATTTENNHDTQPCPASAPWTFGIRFSQIWKTTLRSARS